MPANHPLAFSSSRCRTGTRPHPEQFRPVLFDHTQTRPRPTAGAAPATTCSNLDLWPPCLSTRPQTSPSPFQNIIEASEESTLCRRDWADFLPPPLSPHTILARDRYGPRVAAHEEPSAKANSTTHRPAHPGTRLVMPQSPFNLLLPGQAACGKLQTALPISPDGEAHTVDMPFSTTPHFREKDRKGDGEESWRSRLTLSLALSGFAPEGILNLALPHVRPPSASTHQLCSTCTRRWPLRAR